MPHLQKTGQVWPFMFLGPIVAAVGFGLLFTTDATTPLGKLIGFQILSGVGLGSILQNSVRLAPPCTATRNIYVLNVFIGHHRAGRIRRQRGARPAGDIAHHIHADRGQRHRPSVRHLPLSLPSLPKSGPLTASMIAYPASPAASSHHSSGRSSLYTLPRCPPTRAAQCSRASRQSLH